MLFYVCALLSSVTGSAKYFDVCCVCVQVWTLMTMNQMKNQTRVKIQTASRVGSGSLASKVTLYYKMWFTNCVRN